MKERKPLAKKKKKRTWSRWPKTLERKKRKNRWFLLLFFKSKKKPQERNEKKSKKKKNSKRSGKQEHQNRKKKKQHHRIQLKMYDATPCYICSWFDIHHLPSAHSCVAVIANAQSSYMKEKTTKKKCFSRLCGDATSLENGGSAHTACHNSPGKHNTHTHSHTRSYTTKTQKRVHVSRRTFKRASHEIDL